MDQKTMVHVHNGILWSRKKEGAPTLRNSMNKTGEHYSKWNKPGCERQIPYDLFNKNGKASKIWPKTLNWEQADSDQRREGWEL